MEGWKAKTRNREGLKMKVGKKVKVYQKPNTQEDFEGIAELRRLVSQGNPGYETWVVVFDGDAHGAYERIINFERDKC